MGDAITQHADARHRHGLPRHVSVRRHEYFRGTRHDTTIRNFWCAIYRCGETLRRAKRLKAARRFLSRKLFPANLPKICRSTLRRRANSRDRSRTVSSRFKTGIEIIRAIRSLYPDQFEWKQPPYEYEREKLPIEILLGGPVNRFFERKQAMINVQFPGRGKLFKTP